MTTGWNQIYKDPTKYKFYDLFKPHEDMEKVADFFIKNRVKSVLDLGCGLGRNLIFLSKKGFTVTGIDNSKEAVEKLKQILKKEGVKALIIKSGFEKLPFKKDSFDSLICIQTLNHGFEKNVKKGISEIERVLKPKGVIFITLPGRLAKGKERFCLVKTAKQIEKNTFLPIMNEEKGIPHIIFNLKLIKSFFTNFKIISFWKDKNDYYCFLAKKKI